MEPGKLADLVVLSYDIRTVPTEKIKSMNVLMTVVFRRNLVQKSVRSRVTCKAMSGPSRERP
jgi:hypothetical protein